MLASGSVTRRVLMEAAGLSFTVKPVAVDEAAIKEAMAADGADATETALTLADAKAMRVRDPDVLVIGCDQLLVCDGAWFDKPPDRAAARAQLVQLRGRPHELVTAVTCWRGGRSVWHHVARPVLAMRAFSDTFLDTYMEAEGEAILSSVGSYRMEGLGMQLFDRVEGEHAAILGLPMLPLLGFLRQHGIIPS
ncbi:Maf family protein [Acidisphaera sp. L21]|uniref:Maf family protein n=1 Tax=Acidisphaera sp. L21 TaxID=1641851 RepID=UPI003004D87B